MIYLPKVGLPYKGSKRKNAKKIVDFILSDFPECEYVYDLFGGGGAISFEFIQRPQIKKVFYNEINTGIVSLLKDIRDNGVSEKYYNWIDRETFHKHKKDDDWFGGLVKCCWSFGNNQLSYLFSEQNEKLKKPLHLAIVEKDEKYLKDFEEISGIQIPSELLDFETINERRLKVMGFVKKNKNTEKRIELERLERLQQLQQIERLQQLQQLEQLQQIERLEIINNSFVNVKIETPLEKTVVYLDPPYGKSNTNSYQHGGNNYSEMQEEVNKYIDNSKYRIYLSGYDSKFLKVLEYEHTMSATHLGSTKVNECLFSNQTKEEFENKQKSMVMI